MAHSALDSEKNLGLSPSCPFSLPFLLPSDSQLHPPQDLVLLTVAPCGADTVRCEWFFPSVSVSPIAKILGKVGESLTRICCVRPPVERFTFVGKGVGGGFLSLFQQIATTLKFIY